jgi:glycosyltransferase involved in cell wall biosynthesis
MRILFVNPYYKPYLGGIERIIERVGAYLRDHPRVEAVGVLTTRASFPDRWMRELPGHEMVDGIDVFRCTFRPSSIPRVFHAALSGYVSLDAIRVLRRFKPDVIHFTYGEWWAANLNVYLASARTPHVLSTFFHDVPHTPRTRPLYAVNRWLVPRMNAIHVLTEMERQQVHHAYRAHLDRTIVIPPGVETVDRIPDRSQKGDVTILAVGRLNAHKGQLRLVDMIRRIRQQRPDLPVRLWLVGDDAGDGAAIERFVAEHKLETDVRVFGHCRDAELWDLYQRADIFALPSLYESFGIVFVEAMAHGLPVITYGIGPVPSVLTRGALIVPPADEAGFLEALLSLSQDPGRRAELGQAGRELAQASYSWQSIAERFFDVYAGVVRSAPAGLEAGT